MFTQRVTALTATNNHVTRAELTVVGHVTASAPAFVLEVSPTTIVVESASPVPSRSQVQVKFPKLVVFGEATYSHSSEGYYRTGIAITDVAGVHGLRHSLEGDQVARLAG